MQEIAAISIEQWSSNPHRSDRDYHRTCSFLTNPPPIISIKEPHPDSFEAVMPRLIEEAGAKFRVAREARQAREAAEKAARKAAKKARREQADNENNPNATPLDFVEASSWAGKSRPQRMFLDGRGLIPFPFVTNLSGNGGVGKTLIALQASVACCSTGIWLGAPIRKGPALFFSAEEPLQEMHIRLDEICEAEALDLSDIKGLKIIDLSKVDDAALISGDNRTSRIRSTLLFERLEKTIAAVRPIVVFIDNRGLVVTGNENDRNIASAAMRALQLLAERYQCAIVLLSHPSLAGMNTGTGSSGSTAWFNVGRSTLYLTQPTDDDADDDARVLTNRKSNYAKTGTVVNLKWEFNRFVCTDKPPRADDGIGAQDKAERVFLKLLRWHTQHKLEVSHNPRSPNYAPKLFDAHTQRESVNYKMFRKAMAGLFDRGKIGVEERGSPSQRTAYLVEVE